MKNYRIINFLIMVILSFPLEAQERTIDDVVDNVYMLLTSDSTIIANGYGTPSAYKTQMRVSRIMKDSTTYMYVINNPDGGWAVISNEQRYPALIGYSTNSYFDVNPDNQPDALKNILEFHMSMIDSVRNSSTTYSTQIFPQTSISTASYILQREMDSILLKRNGTENIWRQDENNGSSPYNCNKVYNKFCPDCLNLSCGRTYVGCSAVAIAQVLWYWRWPDYALLEDTIYCSGITPGATTRHYYDWDNILPTINNSTPLYQVDRVAGLLYDCGIASNMLYTNNGSSADVIQIENALNTFNMHWVYNFDYAWTDVASLLISEIQEKRPVICQAERFGYIDDTHTFVIDGYSSLTGLFHVNFGWGGTYNGMWNTSFNDYYVARSFFTELYPKCDTREACVNGIDVNMIENNQDVTLYSANDVCLNQLVIKNGGHLNVSVGGTITLENGFQAQLGSTVKLSPNYNCVSGISSAPVCIKSYNKSSEDISHTVNISIVPNPIFSDIHIYCDEPVEMVSIYNISGQFLLRSSNTEININHLPAGTYIVRIITANKNILQTKIIHL